MVNHSYYIRDRNRLLLIYFLFYYAVLLGFLADQRLLSQYRPIFFNYSHDLTEVALIVSGLPRWMISHPFSFGVADVLAFLVPLPLLWREFRRAKFASWPGFLFVTGMALYLLLADIFWQVHFEPFLMLFLIGFVWTTGRADRFYLLLKGCRYYFLYIFVSAAVWKLARGAVFNSDEMSRILLLHHSDWLTGGCTTFLCRVHDWLIGHPTLSQALYVAAATLEAVFLVGFFTRRFDRWLIALAVLFVIADLVVMRIPYWTILAGIFPLWLRNGVLPSAKKTRRIALYETTHHENLPSLLDLSESRFDQVFVFLKESSWHNLVGEGSPEQRWPGTEFYIQDSRCSNRRFIRQLFTQVRRHGITHLHICTLDNNRLFFALRLYFLGPVHLSLTVHEVNEYFARSFRDFRDGTETIAKVILHRIIRNYHVFLPVSDSEFEQRIPGSKTAFIPSRFYSGRGGATHFPVGGDSGFRIVIPGSVDPGRRDYDSVFEALRLLAASPAAPAIGIVLLGDSSQPAAARIISGFRSLAMDRVTFRSYKGYVPQTTYEEEIGHAHLLWNPLRIHKTGSRRTPETYGVTTASGLTSDLLLNNVPALAPAGFVVPEHFGSSVIHYSSSAEAAEIVLRLSGDPAGYAALREKIHKAFGHFSRENFTPAFDILMGERDQTRMHDRRAGGGPRK